MPEKITIALVGNPNSGKSSLFNVLTGLNQKVGNFPGVTVDKKSGVLKLGSGATELVDLPGTYSLYPRRADEWVAYKVLMSEAAAVKPDLVILVADASNLKRNLLFCSQIIDLKIPVVMAFTMMDLAARNGITIDIPQLERELGVPIVAINPRKGKGINELKKTVEQAIRNLDTEPRPFMQARPLLGDAAPMLEEALPAISAYKSLHYLINREQLDISSEQKLRLSEISDSVKFNVTRTQAEEILSRYNRIRQIMQGAVSDEGPLKKSLFTEKLDKILLHRFWGYVIMLGVLFLLFQAVFFIAQFPMDAIDGLFTKARGMLNESLPGGWLTDLLVNGVLAGLGGIVIFVPQIMILFGLITLLEDTGYMARISFLTDRLMRKVGLNGKSVMPMISGFACAVPAIMSARSIENKKERLLTILVTPFMSCSARLPVYTILISLVIPKKLVAGVLSLQGLVMMGLYILGIVIAMLVALVLKYFIKSKERSYFILELPVYRSPRWNNVLMTMVQKARVFVLEAGKVIMVISIILWVLSNFGPGNGRTQINEAYETAVAKDPGAADSLKIVQQTALLRESYAGHLGRIIEPVIKPLGYDWRIGIAIITSFAAREVFVGTMATLYSTSDDGGENQSLKQRMAAATWPDGSKIYTFAACMSLMVFYVLSMQCMSTLAVSKRETRSWKWPAFQFVLMTGLAYLFALVTYQLLK